MGLIDMKIPDEKLEELKKECAVDNSRLEELIKEMDKGWVSSEKQEEFLDLFKKSNLYMPVVLGDEWFEGIEDSKPGEIRTTGENAGFDINYIKLNDGKRAVPLFTSSELMKSTGLRSSTIVLFMSDLANMLKQSDRYSLVAINPYTDLDIQMPITSFLNLFNEKPQEQKEAMDKLIHLLKTQSIEVPQNIKVVFRDNENYMKEVAINGVFAANVPFKASSFPDFQKELKYTNIVLIPKNKKIVYLGGIVSKDVFDTIIAPETEFELVEELDEFTTVWKVGKQPFYDDDSKEEVNKIMNIVSKYISTSEFDKAMYYVNKLLDMNPSDVSCLEIAGFCYMNLRDYENAFNCFNKAIWLDPNNASCLHHKATLLENLGRWDEALECRDKLIELNPNDYHLWFFKSFDLISLKKYTDAIRCIDKAIELNPKEPILWYSKGTLFGDLEMYEESLEYLDKALELDPNHTLSLNVKGVSLGHLKRFDEAIECFDKSILLNPNDSYPFQLMGNLFLMGLNNYDEAIIYFKEAIRLGSTDSMLWNNLGDAYLNTKEFEKGLDCCDEARFYDPNNFRAWFTTGEIYYELGKYDLAMEYCEKAEKLNPSDLDLAIFIDKIKQTKDDEKGLVWAIDILKDSIPFKPEDIDNNRHEFETMLIKEHFISAPKDDEYNVQIRMHFQPFEADSLYISGKKVQELKINLEHDIEELGYDGALNKFLKQYSGVFF